MDILTSDSLATTAYLEDILVTSKTTAFFFLISERHGLRVCGEKCSFLQREIKYLGLVLNEEGRKPDPEEIKAITDMPDGYGPPKNISELPATVGMIKFNSQFVPGMKTLKEPLNNLLKRDVKFAWTENFEENCHKLEEYL